MDGAKRAVCLTAGMDTRRGTPGRAPAAMLLPTAKRGDPPQAAHAPGASGLVLASAGGRRVDSAAMVRTSQLASSSLFAGFAPSELADIADLATERSFPDGATVLSQGELGRDLFVILSGEVDIVRESGPEGPELLARYGPGDFFGERAAMMTGSRTASVIARGALHCAVLTQWDVLAVLRDDRPRAVEFLQRLRERYLESERRTGR